jgi:tRNA (uracil-5-)-methyltransferase
MKCLFQLHSTCTADAVNMLASPVVHVSTGMLPDTIYALLGQPRISRVVYVSCCPITLKRDVIDLALPPRCVRRPHQADATRSKNSFRKARPEPPKFYVPFAPIKCHAVDMFPHTPHVECVMLLERPAV